MYSIKLILTVINYSSEKEFTNFFQSHKSEIVYRVPCHGTASNSILNYLGLESTEKVLMLCLSDETKIDTIHENLLYNMKLDYAGNGIAITLPIHSISTHTLQFFDLSYSKDHTPTSETLPISNHTKMDSKEQEVNGEAMKDFDYELIFAITNNGFTDLVMDAARNAGATGGTVIHAKSTATEHVRKFLGISIAEEKEILLIVATKDSKAQIMKGIQEFAGLRSEAGTVIFSVPVESVAGLHFHKKCL